MIRKISSLFGPRKPARPQARERTGVSSAVSDFSRRVRGLNRDPYLFVVETDLRLISVFDDLKYDRSDLDILSGPMRRRILEKVAPFGFEQISGSIIENRVEDIRMFIPKFRALGASPFDATRYTARRPQDYYILTPTQVACQIIDHHAHLDAVERIKALIVKHPINLFRIMDFLERKEPHQAFRAAIGHLKLVQREAVESEPLRNMRALR